MNEVNGGSELQRVPSGVAGLDAVLGGGFLKAGVYIVQGVPGAGKTILANEICFRHTANGGRAAFVTLLAESHTRMLQHLRTLDFYDESVMPDRLYYVSGFNALENEGLKGLLGLLRREIRGHQADILVIDGFLAIEDVAPSGHELKKFIAELQGYASASDCTVLLLTNGSNRAVNPEHTMVDGLIELDNQLFDIRTERSLLVRKFRGSGFLRGRHPFRITGEGFIVYPRIEAAFLNPSFPDEAPTRRLRTGVEGLDAMLDGGVQAATTTALLGPTGVGKTTLGLQFLSLSTEAEPGLMFGFYESPARLRRKAADLGFDLAGMERRGEVEIIWQAQAEHVLDELGHRLLDAVARRGVKRLFVDGLSGMIASATYPERINRFFSVLANELRARGVTALYTIELTNIIGGELRLPMQGVSSIIEGLIVLRYSEMHSRMHRLLSITKMRDSDFDTSLREFRITSKGIEVLGPFGDVEPVLTGAAHAPRDASPESAEGEGEG